MFQIHFLFQETGFRPSIGVGGEERRSGSRYFDRGKKQVVAEDDAQKKTANVPILSYYIGGSSQTWTVLVSTKSDLVIIFKIMTLPSLEVRILHYRPPSARQLSHVLTCKYTYEHRTGSSE